MLERASRKTNQICLYTHIQSHMLLHRQRNVANIYNVSQTRALGLAYICIWNFEPKKKRLAGHTMRMSAAQRNQTRSRLLQKHYGMAVFAHSWRAQFRAITNDLREHACTKPNACYIYRVHQHKVRAHNCTRTKCNELFVKL